MDPSFISFVEHPQYVINLNGDLLNLKTMKLLKKTLTIYGYEIVNLNKKTYYVHQLMARAFLPNPHNYKNVDHINGIRCDNQINNLRWCNQKENIRNSRLSRRNKIGYKGITRSNNYIIASFVCCNTGDQINKTFNIKKLGLEQAIKQAVIYRFRQEQLNDYYIRQTPEEFFNSDEFRNYINNN